MAEQRQEEDNEKIEHYLEYFDSFYDMGDPIGAAAHALKALKQDGTVMLVESFANNNLEDNLNPLGRMWYAASSVICVLSSMASKVRL
jgi:hypothetical protein